MRKVKEEELEEFTDKHNGLAEATARDPLEVSSQESETDEAPMGDLGRIDEDVEVSLFGENENDAFHIEGLEDGSQFNGNMDTDNEYDEEVILSAAVVVNEPIPSAVPIPSAAGVGGEPIPLYCTDPLCCSRGERQVGARRESTLQETKDRYRGNHH